MRPRAQTWKIKKKTVTKKRNLALREARISNYAAAKTNALSGTSELQKPRQDCKTNALQNQRTIGTAKTRQDCVWCSFRDRTAGEERAVLLVESTRSIRNGVEFKDTNE